MIGRKRTTRLHATRPGKSAAGAALLAFLLFASGCKNSTATTGDAAPNAPKPVAAPTATPVPTDTTRIKSATAAPFSYLVGPGGAVRVVDADTGKPIATATAAPNALVTVDPAKGVSISNTTVKAGPLPAGHKYEIWLDRK